jgi:tetratricopeptide (TPR) repeat protein
MLLHDNRTRSAYIPERLIKAAASCAHSKRWRELLMLFFTWTTLGGQAASVGDFDAANKFYGQGKFSDAAAAYEKQLQSGKVSAAVYFNLGNTLFKSGQLGRALGAYRQAEQLSPRDPDLRANMQFARNQVQGPTLATGAWERWLGRMTLNEWTLLAAAVVWFLLLLLAVLQLRPALRRSLRGWLVALAIASGLSCACLAAAWKEERSTRAAIVITHDAVIHRGPLEDSPNAFIAHDGGELRVLDQKDEWLQVSSDPRRIGWVRRDQVLVP